MKSFNQPCDRISLDEMYMRIAKVVSMRSSCQRKKVGCIIVKNKQIVSEGYNGTPPGWPSNVCEDDENKTKDCVSHAESNALSKLAASTNSCKDATVYVTLQPCFDCAKQIAQALIKRVVYMEEYGTKGRTARKYLQKCGVAVEKHPL